MGNENKHVLVSIITVCYNSSATIRCTLESMLQQTYEHYEYIVIDGASTDDTLEIIRSYAPRFGGRMTIVSEPDSGIYDAMNKGIRKATGELIGIVNSDDFYEDDALEIMVREYTKLQKEQVSLYGSQREHVVLYGFQRNMAGEDEISVVLYHHLYLSQQMITHPTCFVTRQVYRDFGMFDTTYRSSADYELMLRLLYSEKVYFQPVYEIISNFQIGGMSGSQKGYRETAKLQYRYKFISPMRYMKIIVKSRLYELVHKLM